MDTTNIYTLMQLSNTSIIMDASAYIKELKQKVVRLNQEIACAQDALRHKSSSYPTVCVLYDLITSHIFFSSCRGKGIDIHMQRYTYN